MGWKSRWPFACLLVGYVIVRLALLWSMGTPGVHPDTPSYRAGVSLIGNAPRTWPVPLLLTVLGDRGLTIFQTVISASAFCTLAAVVASTIKHPRWSRCCGALVLMIGIAPRVTTWDKMLITESLAISLTAFLIAALARLDHLPWWPVVGIFTLWVFIRDGHLLLGGLVVVALLPRARNRRQMLLPAGMFVALLWSGLAAQNDRYIEGFNVAANIGGRVAYDDVETWRWFNERGMPYSDGFLITDSMVDRIRALYSDPGFAAWANGDGVGLYARYLVSHPGFVASGLQHLFVDDHGEQMGVRESLSDHSWGQTQIHGYPFGPAFIWPSEADAYTLLLALGATSGALVVQRRSGLDRRWVLPGALLVSTPPHALLAWHATPYEIARHGVVLSFVAVISCWWMIMLTIDHLLDAGPGGDPTTETDNGKRPAGAGL